MKIKKFVADDHPAIQAYALALSRERKWKNEEDWAVRYWSKFAFGKAIAPEILAQHLMTAMEI